MKKMLVFAAIAVGIGIVLALVGFGLNGFTMPQMGRPETNCHDITEEFTDISIDTTIADVRLVLSEDQTASVVCREREHMRHTVTVQDGVLTISFKDTRPWYKRMISFGKTSVTVTVPNTVRETLTVRVDTGDITVPAGFAFRSVFIETDTGDVSFSANAENVLTVLTDTGSITASGLRAQTVKAETDTGKITLTDISCTQLDVKASTGNVKVRNTVAIETLTVKTSTGDVRLEQSDAAEIFVKTSTGDVSGQLLTDKVFLTETSTGRISVPKTTSGGRCEIITSTGNITFEAAPIAEEIFQTAPLPDEDPD